MLKLGVILNELNNDDKSLAVITNLNKLVLDGINVTLFYRVSTVMPPIQTYFSILFQNEVFGYRGPLIDTDIESFALLDNSYSRQNKFLYMWDLEWDIIANSDYNINKRIYHHPTFTYLTRSEHHQAIFQKVWGQKSQIIQEFDYVGLKTYCVSNSHNH